MKKLLMITAGFCVACSSAHAGGYRVALQGQKALGMAHAAAASTSNSEVVFFNPAGMTWLESDMDIVAGLNLASSGSKYQNAATGTSEETDNPVTTPVGLYLTKQHNDKLAWGLGLYTPYGNPVEWPTDWAGSHLVNNISLAAIYIQPTIAYQVNDRFSVGFGPTYATGSVDFNRNLSTSLADENGDRSNVTIEGSGVDAWGLNIGAMAKINDDVTVGVSYRSEITLEARGEDADFENIPASLQTTFPDGKFDADLVLPAELSLGVNYQANEKLTVAFGIDRTFWDAYEKLEVKFDNGAGTSTNPRNYKDANIYRLGMEYVVNDKFTGRAGIYRDETPVQDGYFAPETPRNDATGITLGGSYRIRDNIDIDFSLLRLFFSEVNNSYDFANYDAATQTGDAFEGTYRTSATVVGFGVTYRR